MLIHSWLQRLTSAIRTQTYSLTGRRRLERRTPRRTQTRRWLADIGQTERLEERVLMAADFVVASANGPSAAMVHDTISISYTVTNQGNADVTSKWYDEFYLSDDATYDFNDTFVAQENNTSRAPLAAGGSYTVDRNLTIPNTTGGNRFLLIFADAIDYITENNENNNVYAIPIAVTRPDVDLVYTATTAPSSGTIHDLISLSWTVTNQGTMPAVARWSDTVYLADAQSLEEATDFVFQRSQSRSVPLDPGASYTINTSTSLKNFASGNRFLIFQTDQSNQQAETNEANNTVVLPILLSLPNVDLRVTTGSVPSSANLGDPVTVSWTVANNGTAAAKASGWYDRLYVSNDQTLDSSDVSVSSLFRSNSPNLAGGSTYNGSRTFTVPTGATGGNYLLIATDNEGAFSLETGGDQAETNEANNVLALPFTVPGPGLMKTPESG